MRNNDHYIKNEYTIFILYLFLEMRKMY